VYQGKCSSQWFRVLKGGRARLSALETQAVSRGGAPIRGLLECNWRVAAGKMRLEPTEGVQLPRADPGRGKLVVLQEAVDVDVRQLLRLVGFVDSLDQPPVPLYRLDGRQAAGLAHPGDNYP
jgi:hypothetical protein